MDPNFYGSHEGMGLEEYGSQASQLYMNMKFFRLPLVICVFINRSIAGEKKTIEAGPA